MIKAQHVIPRQYFLYVICVLILYIPVNNFSVMSGEVFLSFTSTKQQKMSCSGSVS